MPSPFHVGIAVRDLDGAMEELTQAVGVRWADLGHHQIGRWRIHVAYSIEGPPHIELIEGPPASPWDSTGGSRLDHLGWWVDDLPAEQTRLLTLGLQRDAELPIDSAAYLRAPTTGIRVELNPRAVRTHLYGLLGRTPPDEEAPVGPTPGAPAPP